MVLTASPVVGLRDRLIANYILVTSALVLLVLGVGYVVTRTITRRIMLLRDGAVLIVGGVRNLQSAEIYDPATGLWSPGGEMTESRYRHTAILLNDGSVLIAGGQSKERNSPTAELYVP